MFHDYENNFYSYTTLTISERMLVMEKKVLYINACARSESRTDRIARALLERLGGLQEEVKLAEMDLQPLSEERLNRRTWLIEEADYTDAMFDLARQFQQADEIVIAAPYWDLSFPALPVGPVGS